MNKFPSIEQFRSVVREVMHREPGIRPTLKFRGSVKLHGTNAAIVFRGDEITYQSRSRELTLETDNAGFMEHMTVHWESTKNLHNTIIGTYNVSEQGNRKVVIFGEWCGSSIQKNVAICKLPKMFVVFAVKIDEEWKDIDALKFEDEEAGLYVISAFPQFDIEIDFENPGESQNQLIALTEAVEKECPVGKAFGVSGVGEGIVWRCVTPEWNDSKFWFKTKGAKHSESKVKTLRPVDMEAVNTLNEFVDQVCTEQRMEHMLQYLQTELQKPVAMESMGDYLRLLVGDILKEESDTALASDIELKSIGKAVSHKARVWYITQVNKGIGL